MPRTKVSRIKHLVRFSVLLTCAGAAQGMKLDTGNQDLVIRWDNNSKRPAIVVPPL